MITCIRDVRRARGLTLDDVARACVPPTTAQTIGRLETGTRTVSVGWLNRIAAALDVAAADLVRLPEQLDLPVAALLGAAAARAPTVAELARPPVATPAMIAVRVVDDVGVYRAGDLVWCERLAPGDFGRALNRDVLTPRPVGNFLFGRLIGIEGARLHVVRPTHGSRQAIVDDPAWIAMAVRLVRSL